MVSFVSAVIVTHQCEPTVAETVEALLTQVTTVYIVDNASGEEVRSFLRQLMAEYAGRVYLHLNDANVGLAAAQNTGIRQALAAGAQWVLLMDDDSIPALDMVERMLAKYDDARIGILAPKIVEQNVSRETRYIVQTSDYTYARWSVAAGEVLDDVALVIASGSLIRADVFRLAGLMAEGYFIDGIDYEFCLRARQHGYQVSVVGDAKLFHRQGHQQRHSLLAMDVFTGHYSPVRRYYMFRNRTFLIRRYARAYPFLIPYLSAVCMWDLVRVTVFEKGRIVKLRAMVHGLWHGIIRALPTESAF